MKRIIMEKGIMFALFIIFYIIFEALTFKYVNLTGLPDYFMLDLFLLMFFASVIFLIKSNKAALIYLSVLMFLFTILFAVNAHLFNIFGDVFSIEYFKVLSEAGEVFEWSFLMPGVIILALGIFAIYLVLNIGLIHVSKKVKYSSNKSYIVNGLFVFLPIILLSSISFDVTSSNAGKNCYVNGENVNEASFVKILTKKAFKHYGMLSLYYKELVVNSANGDDPGEIVDSYSEYYGLLKGKNVITIMAESLQDYTICEELTPNLYKLQQEGLYFKNNYSVNKTNMSEQIGIAGSYYIFDSKNYDIDFALPNMLEGYETTYIHDNAGDFYDREHILKYYGFENLYFHYDLYPEGFKDEKLYPYGLTNWENNTWHWSGDYTLDSVTIKQALPYMTSDKPFYTFWTTLSTHGPYDCDSYNNRSKFIELGYYDIIDNAKAIGKWINPMRFDSKYSKYLDYYEAEAMNLDEALGTLIKHLEDNDLLDDTLIIIYGDHEVYYHDLYLKMAGTEDTSQVDKLYQTTMIMYNPTLNQRCMEDFGTTTIEEFSSPYIIVPTVLDLLGIKHDARDYGNYSIFDDNYLPVFYSTQQRAFMNSVYYTVDCEKLLYNADGSNNQEAFYAYCAILADKLGYCEKEYDNYITD